MAWPMINEKYSNAVEMGYQSMMQWNGSFKDKIKTRIKNPIGYIMWPLKTLSLFINGIIWIFEILFYICIIKKTDIKIEIKQQTT